MQKINFVFSSFLFCSTLISSEWWVMGERKSSKKSAHQKYLPWIIYSHTWKSAHARERMILFVTMAVFIGTASCNLYTHWLPVLLLSQFLYLSLFLCAHFGLSISRSVYYHFSFLFHDQPSIVRFHSLYLPHPPPGEGKAKNDNCITSLHYYYHLSMYGDGFSDSHLYVRCLHASYVGGGGSGGGASESVFYTQADSAPNLLYGISRHIPVHRSTNQ